MDAKLKALKVPALKAILAQHGLSTTGNKPDLIARILADPAALASATGEPSAPSIDDDLLAPPAEFDWDNTSTSAPADTAVKPKSPTKATVALPKPPSAKAAAPPTDAATTQAASEAPTTAPTPAEEDPEVARRRARAARFGIPFVESEPASQPQKGRAAKNAAAKTSATAAPVVDEETLKKRADRFGTQKPASTAASAALVPAAVDPVEEEKKRKRAERFGVVPPVEKKAKVGGVA